MGVFTNLTPPPLVTICRTKLPKTKMQERFDGNYMDEHRKHESKVLSTIGFFIHLILVAIPKDIHLWLTQRPKDVCGQTIVITGGASGIGQRLAEIFAIDLGANVAIVDVDFAKAESVAQNIREKQGYAVAFQSDVTCSESMKVCAEKIKSAFGRVDIVICNAAILFFGRTMELTVDQLQKAYDVNVLGVLHTIRAFLPDFEQENRGQIVAMSSIAGFYGETYGLAYCPTKFAVRGLMECIEMELRDRGLDGIKCTTLCPYFVRTPMILNIKMRPTSRFIPFMSVNRCCACAIDAILKEKVLCFIPGYIFIMAAVKNLMMHHFRAAARNWLNCRYVPINSVATTRSPAKESRDSSENSKLDLEHETQLRPEMVDYFCVPNLLWYLIIPNGLAFTWIVYHNVELVPIRHLSYFGEFVHLLGIEYNSLVGVICLAAFLVHICEAVYAFYLCDLYGLSYACALKWFIQTLILGFPSLSLLVKYGRQQRKRNGKQK